MDEIQSDVRVSTIECPNMNRTPTKSHSADNQRCAVIHSAKQLQSSTQFHLSCSRESKTFSCGRYNTRVTQGTSFWSSNGLLCTDTSSRLFAYTIIPLKMPTK